MKNTLLLFILVLLALAVASTSFGASLQWDKNADADSYAVYIREKGSAEWTEAEKNITGSTWEIPVLAGDNTVYEFSVKAFNACGNSSDYSDAVEYTPCMAMIPAMVKNGQIVLTLSARDNQEPAMPMSDYLPVATPDYSGGILSVSPKRVISTRGHYVQSQTKTDGGMFRTATLNMPPAFMVTLEWGSITGTDRDAVLDFYFSADKGGGTTRSFVWTNPEDATGYVARFASDMKPNQFASGVQGVSALNLIVIGKAV